MLQNLSLEISLPCKINKIYTKYLISNSIVNMNNGFPIISIPMSIIECTDGYAIFTTNDNYYTNDYGLIEFIETIASHPLLVSTLNEIQKKYLKGLLQNSICLITDTFNKSTLLKIYRFPSKINKNNFGWFASIPFIFEIDITNKCNLNCVHCFQNSSSKNINNLNNVFQNLIDESAEIGIPQIDILGGEPFIYPNILELLSEAKRKGIKRIYLTTNGTLINNDNIKIISKIFNKIQVSLHAVEESVHDKITQVPGSFKKTLKAIELLISNGIKVLVNFVVMKHNYLQMLDFVYLMKKIGARARFLSLFNKGRAITLEKISEIDIKIIKNLINDIVNKYNDVEFDGPLFNIEKNINDSAVFYGCPAGRNILKLSNFNNNIYACTHEQLKENNIAFGIKNIWYNDSFQKYRLKPLCNCDFINICGGPCYILREGNLNGNKNDKNCTNSK